MSSHLGSDGGSVEVQLGVGGAVVGVDGEGLGVQGEGLGELAPLEGVVAFLLLRLEALGLLEDLLGLGVVRGEAEHVLEVVEGLVLVVLVVEAHAAHVDGVGVGGVALQDVAARGGR